MTKPGNSGSEEPKQAEQASEPEAADSAPTGTRPEDTVSESEPTSAEPAAEAEPADEKPAEAEPEEAESAEAKSSAAKSAKAERAEAKAAAAKASADEDDQPLMVELEKAPPPPREETLRAKSQSSAAPRRFDEPPPRTLKFSFYFFAASGLVWLISGVIFLINKQVIIDAQVESNDRRDISAEQIASAVNQLLWFYLVIALVFAVFLSLFGWKATEGTRRARTLVTIFSAIMVIFHLLLFSTQFGILSALLALIGLALVWSRTARAYFPPRQPLS